MVIRSELERRKAEEQIECLRSELEKIPAVEQQDEVSRSVANGLRMQISEIENKVAEYKQLKEGLVSRLEADSFDDIGELIIRARIARGWSQGDLAEALDMEPQQVQRYERNDWQKISLWRLQEVVEALDLDVAIRARLRRHEEQDIEPSQIISSYKDSYPGVISSLGLGMGGTIGGFGVGVGEALGSAVSASIGETIGGLGMGISEILGTLPTTISDTTYGGIQAMLSAAYRTPQARPNAPQMLPKGGWDHIPETDTPGKPEYPLPMGAKKLPTLNAA